MIGSTARALGAFVVVALVMPVTCVAVALGASIFLPLPAYLPTPEPGVESRITRVFDADGNEIAVFREFETSIQVDQSDIPQVLKDAVVAAEDRNFYDHGGIDLRGTARALWADVRNRGAVQGGSTITQQYVKNTYTGSERTITRKIKEAILASRLDRQLDKDTILFRYLSTIYFGEGAYGVGAAAETYFREPVRDLNVSEAALLAGVIPAPTRYSPRDHPEAAETKRLIVLGAMLDEGLIDQNTHDFAATAKLWLASNGPAPGLATLVHPSVPQRSSQPWFTDYVRVWLETHLPGCSLNNCPAVYRGGLTVVTTLDPRVQAAAQQEVAEQMDGNDPRLEMALVAVEPPTGYVKAMVGGRDFARSQVNTALRNRQPGSAFKPFVLAAAFDQGIQPSRRYSGAPCETPDGKVIENYGGERYGTIDLRRATWSSVNAVYCRLILDVGVEPTMTMASRLGVSMPAYDASKYGASVSLGAIETSPLEMASAFGVFANHGRRAPPTPVLRVTDAAGEVIIDNTGAIDASRPAVPEVVADNVTDVLRGVLTSGTARGKGLDRPAAGKTGTAQDNANAWFVGYTPTLSTSVWMGYIDCGAGPACEMSGIRGVRGGVTGGSIPAETWQEFMKVALDGVPVTEFAEPAPIRTFADEALRQARRGFDEGRRDYPADPPSEGGYVIPAGPPEAFAPETSTTTTPVPDDTTTTSSTTSTTNPPVTIIPG